MASEAARAPYRTPVIAVRVMRLLMERRATLPLHTARREEIRQHLRPNVSATDLSVVRDSLAGAGIITVDGTDDEMWTLSHQFANGAVVPVPVEAEKPPF